ncbi:hypothetical protein GCM10023346_19370 [Arthrobacter gyeryongensis]|uniref:Uncharacterized protein n=1 Tax=Arthrobacter gyeryongensis TaxID=1650592 RepID=A0ABP9SBB7_9MICC
MPASSAPLKLFVILPVTQEFVAGPRLDGWIYIIPVLPEILLITGRLFPQSEHCPEDTREDTRKDTELRAAGVRAGRPVASSLEAIPLCLESEPP